MSECSNLNRICGIEIAAKLRPMSKNLNRISGTGNAAKLRPISKAFSAQTARFRLLRDRQVIPAEERLAAARARLLLLVLLVPIGVLWHLDRRSSQKRDVDRDVVVLAAHPCWMSSRKRRDEPRRVVASKSCRAVHERHLRH